MVLHHLTEPLSHMPTISEKTTIPSPPDEVWPLLRDPALVAACIPGATLSPDREGDAWKGSIRVKFGPTVAVFKGEATLTYDDAAKTCTIAGRGIDGRGASRALANGIVSAGGTDTTTLQVDGEYNVTGPLETFANAGGVHVARALLAEFSTNMARMVAERRGAGALAAAATTSPPPSAAATLPQQGPGVVMTTAVTEVAKAANAAQVVPPSASPPATPAPAPAPPPVAAAELSLTKLLWAAFLSWLRSLFGKRT